MKLLSIKDAARLLGVSRGRVRLLCQKGRIKATHVGWAWVIRSTDLKAYKPLSPKQGGRPKRVSTPGSPPQNPS